MPTLSLSEVDVAKFAGAFEFSLMQSGITRDELAVALDVHVSQFSKIKSEPDLLKIALIFHKMGVLEERKRQTGAGR